MTARCGGGTSGPQPQYTAVVDMTVQAIAAILAARGLPWIIPAIPFLNLPPLVLASFCSTDPPAMPTLTTAEVNALLGLTLGADFDSGLVKLGDAVQAIIWDTLCQCTSGALTAPPTLAQPSNTAVPVPPAASSTAPCGTFPFSHALLAGAGAADTNIGSLRGINATLVSVVMTSTPHTTNQASTFTLKANLDTGAQTTLFGATITNALQGPLTRQVALPVNVISLEMGYTSAGDTGTTYTMATTISVYCGGAQPNQVQTPCCPPDAATAAQLDLILRMVTLIQRQAVPFAYVYGSNHTGLSGNGSIAVSGLIGVSVDVTTLPASYGSAAGTPVHLYDVGFITLGTADGYSQSQRITSDGTLFLPAGAGIYTSIGYTLSAGVVASIRELVREP